MNIKFGMDNFYVKYLKRFLNSELMQTNTILGKFDKNDLNLLVKYLNLPNVKDMFEVEKEISKLFPDLRTLFNVKLKDDVITWTSKEISDYESQFIINNTDAIKDYCESVGWELNNVMEWVDLSKDINGDSIVDDEDRKIIYNIVYNGMTYPEEIMQKADLNLDGVVDQQDVSIMDSYLLSGKLSLEIKNSGRKNYFPNKDMLVFVNQFDGTFMYGYAIKDGIGIDNIPHTNATGEYKIALYQCKPGQKITIAHNSPNTVRMVIGSSPAVLKQDLTGFMLQNVQDITLRPGEGFQYTVASRDDGFYDGNWVCIQVPSNYGDLSGATDKTVILEMGDINFDGRIDMQDYTLLARYTAEGPGSEELHWKATAKQKAVMDIDKNGIINVEDAEILYKFIQGDPEYPSLGLTSFTYSVPSDYNEGDNVNNLLIIDGHYTDDVNIPFSEFTKDDWVIHEKFFNYLLGMAIHEYSNSENITYLQKLLKEIYPEYSYNKSFFYPGNYSDNMRNIVRDYQHSKVSYTLGDLNRDSRINELDLRLLRDYLTEKDEYFKEHPDETPNDKYSSKVFSDVQRQRADVNQDGVINEDDYDYLKKQVNGEITTLDNYDISFILGWYDVQTEGLLETDVNISENISEVSK